MLFKVKFDPFQHTHADLLVSHFSPAEAQGNFSFVTVGKKLDNVAQLDLIVVLIRSRTKLDFFDLDNLLLLFGLCQTLGFLILELAKVHQAADWRRCHRRNFNQIDAGLLSHLQPLTSRKYSELLALHPD